MSSVRLLVLVVLCLQNSLFTVLRRYSLGIRKEEYSKYELLLVGELVKLVFSAYMIQGSLESTSPSDSSTTSLHSRLVYLVATSRKMVLLALIYGAMNTLSLISLRNIGAGMFTIFAQVKILTTATFSTIILRRQYTSTQWRALVALSFGVLLFSEPIWGEKENRVSSLEDANAFLGTTAVLIEVTLSGFASIYFEKVIKTDRLQLSIWERNFQLALGSLPVYMVFLAAEGGSKAGYGGGWSWLAAIVAMLGAAGGLLVALSIKYGDAILKTLATTGSIILAALLDYLWLGGPLTPAMVIAGVNVILAICNYTFDATPKAVPISISVEMNEKSSDLLDENDKDEENLALIE